MCLPLEQHYQSHFLENGVFHEYFNLMTWNTRKKTKRRKASGTKTNTDKTGEVLEIKLNL